MGFVYVFICCLLYVICLYDLFGLLVFWLFGLLIVLFVVFVVVILVLLCLCGYFRFTFCLNACFFACLCFAC